MVISISKFLFMFLMGSVSSYNSDTEVPIHFSTYTTSQDENEFYTFTPTSSPTSSPTGSPTHSPTVGLFDVDRSFSETSSASRRVSIWW